jgi:hypothetical protein
MLSGHPSDPGRKVLRRGGNWRPQRAVREKIGNTRTTGVAARVQQNEGITPIDPDRRISRGSGGASASPPTFELDRCRHPDDRNVTVVNTFFREIRVSLLSPQLTAAGWIIEGRTRGGGSHRDLQIAGVPRSSSAAPKSRSHRKCPGESRDGNEKLSSSGRKCSARGRDTSRMPIVP